MSTSRPEELEDLLQPTLQAEADPVHMRGAWSPWTVAALAIFGGPLTAGVLYGENYRRLGRPALLAWCLAGSLVLIVLLGYGSRWMLEPAADREARMQAIYSVSLPSTLLVVLPLASLQQRRYRVFLGGGGETGSRVGLFALFFGSWLGNYFMYQVLLWTT
jgi:hypothetical protein